MKTVVLGIISVIFLSCVGPSGSSGFSTHGVFVGTSPCTAVSRSLLQVPATANCEMIKWKLALHEAPASLAPTTYQLNIAYGLPEQGTNGLAEGETRLERKGKWTIVRANSTAIVYRLETGKPEESLSFLKVDQNLLHLLDQNERLAIGTDGWSYTLNRSGTPARRVPEANAANIQLRPSAASASRVTGPSILGRFVGRTPCLEAAKELNRKANADCTKVKWDLTLFHDATAGTPAGYQLRSTFHRDRAKEGTWAIIRGTKADPNAVIYQLDPGQQSLSFPKADEDILFLVDEYGNFLVGNENFSYTIHRTHANRAP